MSYAPLIIGIIGIIVSYVFPECNYFDLGGQGWYFFFGVYLSTMSDEIFFRKTGHRVLAAACVMFCGWAISEAAIVSRLVSVPELITYVRPFLKVVMPVVGVFVVWHLSAILIRRWPKLANSPILSWSFLVYCIHYLYYMLVIGPLHAVIGRDGLSVLLISGVMFIWLVCMTFVTCWLCSSRFKKITKILSGGRVLALT